MTGEVLLQCDAVSKRYGGVVAVSDVSLEARAGEVVALIGPNGAGKTTLIDLITGQQPMSSGRVLVRGVPLAGPPSRRARRAAFARTFQHPLLAMDLTVRENIRLGLCSARFASPWRGLYHVFAGMIRPGQPDLDRRIDEVAESVHLTGLGRPCGELTLGEQRLTEVARAVVRDPSVLLLDEPFAGGDTAGVQGMIDAIAALRERSCAILVVDHNIDVVARIADRVVLLDRGRPVFTGPVEECLSSTEMQAVYFGKAADRA
ncbi:ABC transporter ATP-binding protein [Amycolatopsis jejuensis]|uniref:ABC transporter ATP-binding protein n=1 Tax=Amycolatopsis jejuensis TaxID=330084 RepID=UPI0005253182|nr:ATP-binding cassette domain-containing protein [Amycolatopsis jejuensis]